MSSYARPTVSLVTSHGRQTLTTYSDERMIDLLNRHRIPWSAVSIYVARASEPRPVPAPCLDHTLDQFSPTDEVLLYFNRNVNPFMFNLADFRTVESDDPAHDATEYFYQRFDNNQSSAETFLKKLSPDECKTIIGDRVADALRAVLPSGGRIVVGVSGGGDSNALLYGLSRIDDIEVHPIIIKGIPEWDAGVARALTLCKSYGLDLKVMEEAEVKELVGMSAGGGIIDRFEHEFKGDDFEFLATLLIRLALSRHAKNTGTSLICTGLNLEDVVCEATFRLAAGLKPAPFPMRTIGSTTLLLPLWLCPKRILDGCFPEFSRDNYDARYPCFSVGRNAYYSLVYSLQSQFPAMLEKMALGLSTLSLTDPVTYVFNHQLGFEVERNVPFPLLAKFQRMLGRSLTVS